MEAVWEPRAGILFPELAIEAQLELATGQGAVLHFDEPIVKWEPIADGLRVFTGQRSATAGRLLLSVGAWLTRLLPELNLPLAVERQVLFWFEPANQQDQFRPGQCPIHLWEYEAQRFFYGFPNIGHGVKAALHHQGQVTSPETVSRTVEEREVEEIRRVLQRFLPAANGRLLESAVCLYTNTPDEHFLLDFHPTARSVLIASPCSGHGFKFSPVIGEIAAQLLSEEEPQFDLSLFKIERLLR
jgi:sarcosine oxidase